MGGEVRIGMVGAGWMCGAHVSAITNACGVYGEEIGTPVFEIVADINERAAETAQEKFGFETHSSDWRRVVESDRVDLVDIVTPNAYHYEIAKAAMANGKHVYCEKPLTLAAEESRELAEIASGRDLVNYVAYNNVVNPAIAYIKELVESGKLGTPVRFDGTYDQDMLLDPAIPITWRHRKAEAGSGALGDLGSHLLSVSQYLMGDVSEVAAVSRIAIPERPVAAGAAAVGTVETEDLLAFVGRYASGAIAHIATSRVATGRKNALTVEIQGTRGTATFDLERLNEVNVYFHDDDPADRGFRTVLMGPEHGDFGVFQPASGINISYNDMKVIEAAKVLSAVTKGSEYVCDFAFGARIDATIRAILRSAESKQWVAV